MKLISFSLWGNNPKYTIGAIKNAELANHFYPDWISRFYIHKDVETTVIKKIKNIKNTEVCIIDEEPDWKAMFWRFLPAFDQNIGVFICRDCDSRLNEREAAAVNEWLNSDKNIHIMRDHPWHGFAMLGGMIGFKKQSFQILAECLKSFKPTNEYGTDYVFFHNILYPKIKESAFVHDEFFEKKYFPTTRKENEFVGQVFDENDATVTEHIEALNKIIKNEILQY